MRQMQRGWLNAYVNDYIVKQESPKQFHFWIGASIIAGAIQRKVWVNRGAYKLYPNMFVFLVTESGSCRKGAAMRMGLSFLRELKKVAILYERTSLEGMMVRMERNRILPGGRIVHDGSLFIVADELSDLFGKASYTMDLVSALTSMYTCGARFDLTTRNKGILSVINPCPCILAGTTPEQFGDIFPAMVKFSGFLGRVVLVTGRREERVPLSKLNTSMEQDLYDDLLAISDMDGEMKLTEEAEEWFDKWYTELPEYPDHSMPAFHERKHDHLFKLAMILSASENDEMLIHIDHLETALSFLNLVEDGIDVAIQYIGATNESIIAERALKHMKGCGGEVPHSKLMRNLYKYVKNAAEFRAILDTLIEANIIVQKVNKGAMYYKLTKVGWNIQSVSEKVTFDGRFGGRVGRRGKKK